MIRLASSESVETFVYEGTHSVVLNGNTTQGTPVTITHNKGKHVKDLKVFCYVTAQSGFKLLIPQFFGGNAYGYLNDQAYSGGVDSLNVARVGLFDTNLTGHRSGSQLFRIVLSF